MQLTDLLTIPDAARLLSISQPALHQAYSKSRIVFVYADGHPRVDKAEVERYRKTIVAWLEVQIRTAKAALVRRNRQLARCEGHLKALQEG